MKKALLCIPLMGAILTCISARAQTEKGNFLISNEITDFKLKTNFTQKAFGIGLSPRAGYFITNNLAVGIYAQYDYESGKSLYQSGKNLKDFDLYAGFKRNSLETGIFTRYYLKNIHNSNQRSCFFTEANFGFRNYWSNFYTNDNDHFNSYEMSSSHGEGRSASFMVGLGLGWNYFVTKNTSIGAMVKYNLDCSPTNGVYAKGIGFNIGAQFFLPTKKKKAPLTCPK